MKFKQQTGIILHRDKQQKYRAVSALYGNEVEKVETATVGKEQAKWKCERDYSPQFIKLGWRMDLVQSNLNQLVSINFTKVQSSNYLISDRV